jgi:hypothetical protein
MNCLYITLFFNTVAGTVQTFIKSWNQLLYPRVIEVYRLPLNHVMTSCTSLSSSKFFPARRFFRWRNKWKSQRYHKQQQFVCEFPLDVHLLRWEIVWRNAPRIWRNFGSALTFQTRLTQTKPVLPLSNEHDSQVKDHGRKLHSHLHIHTFHIAGQFSFNFSTFACLFLFPSYRFIHFVRS